MSPVVTLRLYAAPLPRELGSLALVAPPALVDEVRYAGALLAHHPAPFELAVLAPAPLDPAGIQGPAGIVLRRAAAAATMAPPADQPDAVGPHGTWYAALVTWGWLSILGAGESALSTLGGLWLAAGLPLVRRAYRRAQSARHGQAALGLGGAIDAASIRVVEHAGLQQVAAVLAPAIEASGHGEHSLPVSGLAKAPEAAEAPDAHFTAMAPGTAGGAEVDGQLQRAATLCPVAGVEPLAAFYRSLAARRPPAAVWTPVPAALLHAAPAALTGPRAEAPAASGNAARPA